MIEVIPSMPVRSFAELEENLARVHGIVSAVQIDVCDGSFVTNRSWPMNPADRAQFERIMRGDEALPFWEELDFEVDLMAHDAQIVIPEWIQAGVSRVLVHIETRHDFSACLAVAENKIELGVAISLGTPIEQLDAYIPHVGVVQIMGIAKIGVQGQPFDPRVIETIKAVRERYPDVIIEVDGAVNRETAPLLVSAGARRLAPGSFILKSENPKEDVKFLKSLS